MGRYTPPAFLQFEIGGGHDRLVSETVCPRAEVSDSTTSLLSEHTYSVEGRRSLCAIDDEHASAAQAPALSAMTRLSLHFGSRFAPRATQLATAILVAWLLMAVLPNMACAKDEWADSRQVGPFLIQSNFSLTDYDRLFAELPELQRELSRTLGLPPAKEPIYVYLFADEAQYRAYIEKHFPNVPFRPALFVKEGGPSGVYAYRKPDLDIDLRHECTHAMLHGPLPTVPLWLDEGLAKYFEVPPQDRAFDHPYFDALRWNMRLGMIRKVESLEERGELAEMSSLDYRYSWAWVHFMLHGPEGAHATLVNYLAQIQRGSSPGQLSIRLAATVPHPTEKMIQHFKHWHE